MELIFTYFFLVIFGGCLGSFTSMLIHRLPIDDHLISLSKPRSFCPQCKATLDFFQLIPFVSFLISKGKCSKCNVKIRINYLINEIVFAAFILFIFHTMDFSSLITWVIVLIFMSLYIQSMMDMETLLLSQPISIFLIIAGLSLNTFVAFFTLPIDALLGLIFGYGILFCINQLHKIIRSTDGIGSGDFLLLGGIGSLFGASAIGPILLMGSGITLSLYFLKQKSEEQLPLGFGLGIGAIFYCLLFLFLSIA